LEYDFWSSAGIASFALPGIPFPMFDRLSDSTSWGSRHSDRFFEIDVERMEHLGEGVFSMINFVATATLAISLMAASPKTPQWEHSYGKALEATRAGQDPLLVVLDKPNSEKARIEPALLSEDEASDNSKLLSPYRLCHVDVTTEYGQKVAKAFHATEFPQVAIIDKTGSVVIYRKTGQVKQDEWVKILADYKSGDRAKVHVVLKPSDDPSDPSYCPKCHRQQY
jgi:hypothetical protein